MEVAPTPGTAATTKTMRNALEELPWDRAKAVSSSGGTATDLALDRPDIAYSIRRSNQDISQPKVRTEARLKRVARYLLGEPELIWTFLYQEMPSKLVVRTDANWTGQDSEDQKCFSCEVVRFGGHVIDVVCVCVGRSLHVCTLRCFVAQSSVFLSSASRHLDSQCCV